ncbi:MAG: RNB domain-containing ribonuclease [Flavobacterium sp.]|nr:RNB domain-containing ribonuclease [Aeromicrobium sp.]
MLVSTHDFESVRSELGLPPSAETDSFSPDVLAEAAEIASLPPSAVDDATDIPFVTIDPPGSMDLDQAMFLERVGKGFRVHYAIADLGSAITSGGAVDTEARQRGQTLYLPDGRVPLHPPVLSEGSLSLLPDQVRGAALWTIDVDESGHQKSASVRRATVKSVAQLDYHGAQASFDHHDPHPSIEALADLGGARQRFRVGLGAIELALPEQEILREGDDWRLHMRVRMPVDAWNAEISLLTGMAAAQLMLAAGVGLLRTLPTPEPRAMAGFLRTAAALGVPVPSGATPARVLADLDPDEPKALALMTEATRLLRGAGYEAFDDSLPARPEHGGIGGPYAHVTAPLRRLADRFGTEVCLAICQKTAVPAWVRDALPTLPEIMSTSDHLASKADRTCVDQVEVWMMQGREGERFEAVVLHSDRDGGEIMLLDPPAIGRCTGKGLREGSRIEVRLGKLDVARRRAEFAFDGGARSSLVLG